jgi:hypothetical protein
MSHRTIHLSFALQCLVLACIAVALGGCGRQSNRLAIEGHVTFEGQPLPDGKISFTPQPGTSSPTAGATIREGAFAVPRDKGVRPGKFRVEIRAVRATGKTMRDDLSGEVIARKEPYIPKRYNEASELVAEIKPDDNNKLEFALTGK